MSSSEKIKQFIKDTALQEAVKKAILASFMKRKETEVTYLAAQMLAAQFLEEAWASLSNYKEQEQSNAERHQIGL